MWIKKFLKYKESLNESLSIWYDSLLSSIKAQEVRIDTTLHLKTENTDLEILNKSDEFVKSLASLGLKRSPMELTSDYETFMSTPCRFMFISNSKSSDLETPLYLMLQVFNKILNKWEATKCYKINDDIKNFYDQLSSKKIEIIEGNDKFVYETGNGNEWTLKSNNPSDIYKKDMRKEDLDKISKEREVKINVI
jgi:hypothetical protein